MYILHNKLNSRIRHFKEESEARAWLALYNKYYGKNIYYIEYIPEYQENVKFSAGEEFNKKLT